MILQVLTDFLSVYFFPRFSEDFPTVREWSNAQCLFWACVDVWSSVRGSFSLRCVRVWSRQWRVLASCFITSKPVTLFDIGQPSTYHGLWTRRWRQFSARCGKISMSIDGTWLPRSKIACIYYSYTWTTSFVSGITSNRNSDWLIILLSIFKWLGVRSLDNFTDHWRLTTEGLQKISNYTMTISKLFSCTQRYT